MPLPTNAKRALLLVAWTLALPALAAAALALGGEERLGQAVEPFLARLGLARGVFWLGLAGALAALGAALGGARWLARLARQEDQILDSCRRMALGEPGPPEVDLAAGGELARIGLAIQIMREALLEQQSHYQRFFDAAHDMFISISPAGGRVLDANPAFLARLGLEREQVLGRKVGDFVRLDTDWAQAMAKPGQLLSGRLRTPKGVLLTETSLSLETGPGGQSWFLGAIVRDVTERERLAGELLRKTRALEMALEEIRSVEKLKDEFLTTLSHELKTPLVSLKGFLQLLLRGAASPEESQAHLEVCWRNLLKLEQQINNLLDLARLSQSKDHFRLAPVDLVKLLGTECENLRPTAEESNVSLSVDETPSEGAVVLGNAEKLIQLLDNLIVNAIKYNKKGGQVHLSVERGDGRVTLAVRDSGVGIAREHMANIFNKFYRADITGTGRLEGLGIGLALVQEIVKLHGGDIAVQSELGKGTTFTVTLETIS